MNDEIGGDTMKALITGFTGMVGSHLADYLLDNTEWEILGFSRWIESFENVAHLVPRIKFRGQSFRNIWGHE